MATWGDQTCQRFEATAVGFETGFSRLRVRPSNRYAIAPHNYWSAEKVSPTNSLDRCGKTYFMYFDIKRLS